MFVNYLAALAFATVAVSIPSTSTTPIPYQWGKYNPAPAADGKLIIVDWNSPEGLKRLKSSKHNTDFFQLAHAFQPQINPVYATVASAVVVLNAMRQPKHTVGSQSELEIAKPKALGGGNIPFPAYSQLTFFTTETDAIKHRDLVTMKNANPSNENDKSNFKPGLGLNDLQQMLTKVYKAKAEVVFADAEPKKGVKSFREELKKVLSDSDHFILANFKGDLLGAATEGTVSPLAAYDAKTDSVLVLDVTGHKNPWYWVPLTAFYKSMNTQYDGSYRGYIRVSDEI